ncbi:S8 family serine peptidase, partial [Leifsonia sp. SIMBA_070]|uniref:S8 family serine peptidase n=1 Tax=Leifsonia sp. SIMBA_070 TaxID=3085810 RepID=UPI003979E14B
VDSGVDWHHPDLADNIWTNADEIADNGIDDDGNGFVDDVRGWDFVDEDNDPLDRSGHGTHVSGTIAASDNGFGVTGV